MISRKATFDCFIMAAACFPLTLQASEPTFEEAKVILFKATEAKRVESENKSFEEFKASVYREPFEGGKFIVNGDTPIENEKKLREFFDSKVARQAPTASLIDELAIMTVGGLDVAWSDADKRRLTYCVSNGFAGRHAKTLAAMQSATEAWEAIADVDFIYLGTEDNRCDASNRTVTFDVRPANAAGRYLARAFFPNEDRSARNVLIDESAFQLDPNGKLTLTGILRHELGHTLGFRHEHTRPDSGKCFEDNDWRPLSDYDAFSVMHYPQCNGLGDWSLNLTAKDKTGAACVYGAALGFAIDPSLCASRNAARTKAETFNDQIVKRGEQRVYGPFRVTPDTPFIAEITAAGSDPGDPDLYVKFDDTAAVGRYDCRPFRDGVDERCAVVVPDGKQAAFVMVRGYDTGRYTLAVTYTLAN